MKYKQKIRTNNLFDEKGRLCEMGSLDLGGGNLIEQLNSYQAVLEKALAELKASKSQDRADYLDFMSGFRMEYPEPKQVQVELELDQVRVALSELRPPAPVAKMSDEEFSFLMDRI